ncbi:MAG: hypothetical protein QM765_31105 [Myxococcales bacterium]
MRRIPVLQSAFVLALLAASCGGTASTPSLTVSPGAATILPGGEPLALGAQLSGADGTITWSLSPAVGTLSAESGASVTYTPPATVDAATEITITAAAAGLQGQAKVTLRPLPTLAITPAQTVLLAGAAPLSLSASLKNASGTVSWSLSPAVGTLSAQTGTSVTYSAPSALDGTTAVIITASAAGLQAQATVTVGPAPVVVVSPAQAYVQAGAAPVTLTAVPAQIGDTVNWSLSPAVGTLSDGTGTSVQYTPPASVERETPVVVTASAGGRQGQAQIVVTPFSTLSIAPATTDALEAGAPIAFTATLAGSTAPIAWTLSPAVGSLSASTGSLVSYTPPVTLDAEATVVITAVAAGAQAHAVVALHPLPELSVSPAALSLTAAGAPVAVAATLRHSTETIHWTLDPSVGSLSASTGAAVTYTPPASLAASTQVTLTASAAGLTASTKIDLALEPLLTVSPAATTLPGGAKTVTLSATLQNLTGAVLWSLSPAVGTLSATSGPSVVYTSPEDVPAATAVTVYAMVGRHAAQSIITVTPAAKLTVSPATSRMTTADAPLALSATLLNSTEAITWTLAQGAPGSLSASTGATTVYTPPTTVGLPATVVITAAAAGLTAQATVTVEPPLGNDNPPLGDQRFIPLTKVTEYLLLGLSHDGTQNNQYAIDPYLAYGKIDDQPISLPPGVTAPDHAQLHRSQNADLVATNRKVARPGNLDDDFVDETVLLTWAPGTAPVAKLSILDASLSDTSTVVDPTFTTVVPTGIDLTVEAGQANTDYDLALADLDGDGLDEVIVLGTVQPTNTSVHFGKLFVFDDLKHGCASLHAPLDLKGDLDATTGYRGMFKAKVAAGSMKEDRSVQIVVGWYDQKANNAAWAGWVAEHLYVGIGAVSFALYDGATLGQIGSNHKTGNLMTRRYEYFTNPNLFNIALADVDGDRKKELVVGAWESAWWHDAWRPNSQVRVDLYDDLDASSALAELGGAVQGHPWVDIEVTVAMLNSYPERFLAPIDYNGDQVEEGIVGPWPFHVQKGTTFAASTLVWDDALMPVDKWAYNYSVSDLGVGDVNGDLRQDFLLLLKGGQVKAKGLRDHLESVSGTPLHKNYAATPDYVVLDQSGTLATSSYDGTATCPGLLVPANVDNDSMLLEYAANPSPHSLRNPKLRSQGPVAHSLVYKDNKIIALLAAPPLTDGLGQNEGNSSTTFGTFTGGSFGTGAEFSTRAGVLFGTDFELLRRPGREHDAPQRRARGADPARVHAQQQLEPDRHPAGERLRRRRAGPGRLLHHALRPLHLPRRRQPEPQPHRRDHHRRRPAGHAGDVRLPRDLQLHLQQRPADHPRAAQGRPLRPRELPGEGRGAHHRDALDGRRRQRPEDGQHHHPLRPAGLVQRDRGEQQQDLRAVHLPGPELAGRRDLQPGLHRQGRGERGDGRGERGLQLRRLPGAVHLQRHRLQLDGGRAADAGVHPRQPVLVGHVRLQAGAA